MTSDEPESGLEMTLKIGILECGTPREILAARHGTYADWFERMLRKNAEMPIRFSRYAVYKNEFPALASDCQCWIITGSSSSVLDETDWMTKLKDFIQHVALQQKVIGVCFGHQLIAETYGGKVEPSPHGWGVGVHRYEVAKRSLAEVPTTPALSLIASHQDWVARAPDQAVVLGGNSFCPIGMMRLGENILTIQLHPEMTPEFSNELYASRAEILGQKQVKAAIQSLQQPIDDAQMGHWFRNFAKA
jgi:GMP synthase-like glutamine amidotransferase